MENLRIKSDECLKKYLWQSSPPLSSSGLNLQFFAVPLHNIIQFVLMLLRSSKKLPKVTESQDFYRSFFYYSSFVSHLISTFLVIRKFSWCSTHNSEKPVLNDCTRRFAGNSFILLISVKSLYRRKALCICCYGNQAVSYQHDQLKLRNAFTKVSRNKE